MPPKRRHKGRKAVAQRKLDERLDVFLRAYDIQAGRKLDGPTSSSFRRPPETRARGAPPRAPSPAAGSPSFASAQSPPPLPTPFDTGGSGDPYDNATMSGTNAPETGGVSLDPLAYRPDKLRGLDSDGNPAGIELPKLQTTQRFIDLLREAVLEGSGMHDDDIKGLREPGPKHELVDPSPLVRSIRHFLNNTLSSREHYETLRRIELMHNSDDAILSFDQVKRRIRWLSGVVPLEHDMCTNSCVAFTGPYSELDCCPRCSESRHFPGSTKPQSDSRRFRLALWFKRSMLLLSCLNICTISRKRLL